MNNSWVEFYMEFADKLLEFKSDRKRLVKKLKTACSTAEVNFPDLGISDIDPFTAITMFNKYKNYDNSIDLMNALAEEFEIKADVSDDYYGPVMIPLSAKFFDSNGDHIKDDINNLWEFFEAALNYSEKSTKANQIRFIELYDTVIEQRNVKWNLTMGLYWARPYVFLSLDSTNRKYINNNDMLERKLTNPPSGEEYLQIIDQINSELDEIDSENGVNDFVEFTAWTWAHSNEPIGTINEGENLMNIAKNTILYGPPGTGKTYHTAYYAVAIIEGKSLDEIFEEDESEVFERFNSYKSEGRIEFTTFHQSYGYEEFIEGIKPVMLDNSNIGYEVEPGVFKHFCDSIRNCASGDDRSNDDRNYVFIIDEINRGNISKIFGELITLVEDNKRLGCAEECTALLPYSKQPFGIPNNLYILGTMNTADRSIISLDTALRRRFNFIEISPNSNLLDDLEIEGISVSTMLDLINVRISLLYDREHTIGHAYFMSLKNDDSIENLADIFRNKIIPLLQEYFYDDYRKIRWVLGDNQKQDEQDQFIVELRFDTQKLFGDTGVGDEAIYETNTEAFYNPNAYIGIYEN